MNPKPAVPKDAASLILLDSDSRNVLWAKRNPKLRFLGGFHGFPGGRVDETDFKTDVRNCGDPEMVSLIACAVRETFEEVGVLIVRNGEKLTTGQIASLHDDLISGRSTFDQILNYWDLWIDAEDFHYSGFWTTPEFSPIRFKTHFFIANCPLKQEPYRAISELQEIEFIRAEQAIDLWADARVLMVPPTLFALRELADFNPQISAEEASKNLLTKSTGFNGHVDHMELTPRLICLPLRTKTLPPATHTNCFIAGKKKFVVIDAATPFPDEQNKLFKLVDEMVEKGYECEAIIVSHLHPDHFGGETALKNHLLEKFGLDIPISAHKITADSLKGKVVVEKYIDDEKTYRLQDKHGVSFELAALHTPGHARGHLCFYDEELGFLLSSDNVVGLGTVVIAPPEGNMGDYLDSLERMKNLLGLRFLCGSHGSAVSDAEGKIEEYISHRNKRENQILDLLNRGFDRLDEIVGKIYLDLDPKLVPLAKKTVEAHLEKLTVEKKT